MANHTANTTILRIVIHRLTGHWTTDEELGWLELGNADDIDGFIEMICDNDFNRSVMLKHLTNF